jgi:transposase-like protein
VARMKGPKKTSRYTDEFKIKAVQLANHPDIVAKDVADDLGWTPPTRCASLFRIQLTKSLKCS